MAQRKMPKRKAVNLCIASRFPKGSTRGDTLAGTVALGNSFRSVDSLVFGSVAKRNPNTCKRFGEK